MNHHPIFQKFSRTKSIGTGRHTFDFLGVATDVAYKKGWEKHALRPGAEYTPDYPPLNEHYFDWIALLTCLSKASGTFRMAELGAGWAPWLVRAAFASRQLPEIQGIELLGVEADPTHYGWVRDHFLDNQLKPDDYHLLHGAVSNTSEVLKFPKLADPGEDYGASVRNVTATSEFISVQGYTLKDLLGRFTGPLDFMHVDIQGAEYDALPPAFDLLSRSVKALMVGTHLSGEHHQKLLNDLRAEGWMSDMVYPRNEDVLTEFGQVKFGDGFLFLKNPRF